MFMMIAAKQNNVWEKHITIDMINKSNEVTFPDYVKYYVQPGIVFGDIVTAWSWEYSIYIYQ